MSNVCYLAVILIFLVVNWWLLLITALYLVATARNWRLLLVTACYCSFPAFSMNASEDISLSASPGISLVTCFLMSSETPTPVIKWDIFENTYSGV